MPTVAAKPPPVKCRRCRRPLRSPMARALRVGDACFRRLADSDSAALLAAVERGVQLELDYDGDTRR